MADPEDAVFPPDVIHMLCEQLSENADFSTLYSFVVSSKVTAVSGAIAALYRISHESPIKGGGSEAVSLAERGLHVQKWSILWRSVIASAFGTTMFPYCRYIRMLDLRDLFHLLEDDKFRDKIFKQFFSDPLTRYRMFDTTSKVRRAPRLDFKKIVRAVGNEVLQHAPFLDALCEPPLTDVFSTTLIGWAPKLAGLRRLDLFDGKALTDSKLRHLLNVHCPHLEIIKIYSIVSQDADTSLANFIENMRPNQLQYFENHSDCGISRETCQALNRHGGSLHTLKLALSEDGLLATSLLQDCVDLKTLSIASDRATPDLKLTQHDTFIQMTEWLKRCSELKDLAFDNILSAPDLVVPLLKNDKIRLERLDINSLREDALYVVKDHHDFHRALAEHRSLQLLHLCGDSESVVRDDLEILLNTLCSLSNLNDLKLSGISDYFTDEHINMLASTLPELEELFIGGYGISDAVWDGISKLRKLKTLNFSGITNFTSQGIVEFIEQLGPGNRGFGLSIDNAESERGISADDQDMLRDLIALKAEGKFDYQLLRDPNLIAFDDSDDSD